MPLCIRDLSIIPSGGYNVVVPDTGATVEGGTYQHWKRQMRDHYRANNLPIGVLWEQQIQDLICKQKPGGWCAECLEGQVKATPDIARSEAKACCGKRRTR